MKPLFFPGQELYALGLDMDMKKVTILVEFVSYKEGNPNFDCVILCDDGLQVLCKTSDLSVTYMNF